MPMSTWTGDDLSRIGAAEELELASARPDGSLRPYVTMWVVRAGDELFDAAYHSKYGRYGPRIVGSIVGPKAEPVTILLQPRGASSG
jgi:hypothetical protein